MSRPPLPPFTAVTAAQKARLAEDAWNSRDPARVALAYTEESRWRNRAEFIEGRAEIEAFLTRKWRRELDYRLIKEVWAFRENRIAVRFAYEWRDDSGHWFRSYGNENWQFDANGYMAITDRAKDVIKSGGEWISSIDIENIAMGHPSVAMAACIGMPHPKWDERPVVAVVKKPGAELSREELLAFFEGRTAKWQIPDDVIFVDAIPIGATGKMLKTRLREQLKGYTLPGL